MVKNLIGQGRSVFIINGTGKYKRLFEDAMFNISDTLAGADVVCFTGGEDVDPSVYHEKPLVATFFNPRRDQMEMQLYEEAKRLGKMMVGICRGGQFLNVMNGGKLWQDVDNHTRYHRLTDVRTGAQVYVSSTHHQMMRPTEAGCIFAFAQESKMKCADKETWMTGSKPTENDCEVVWYRDSHSLCFQPHPEFDGVIECRAYFWQCFQQAIDMKGRAA